MKLLNALVVATLAAKGGKKKAGKYREKACINQRDKQREP
jgi:hypothetical protein